MVSRHLFFILAAVSAFAAVALAQEFDAASIRPSQPGKRQSIEATPGNLAMRNVTLKTSLRWAYGVHDYQISGGPAWMQSDLFDIIARPASASSTEQLRSLLQSLIAGRFKLALHREMKEIPV